MKTLGRILIIFGLISIFFGSYLFWQRNNPLRLSFSQNAKVYAKEDISKPDVIPTEIKIGTVNIDLPIVASEIKNNHWEVTPKGVSYLSSSVIPGKPGNSILYGHNWTSLLGPMVNVKVGDAIQIIYADGTTKNFKITFIQTVSPDDISILNETTIARITIYTCVGFLDSKRFVVVAEPIYNGV